MKKTFNIDFSISINEIAESARITEEFIPFLENSKMYFYYPFSGELNEHKLHEQIAEDSATFDLETAEKKMREEWNQHKEKIISLVQSKSDIADAMNNNFKCVLTFYGPYGYFYTPDTVFVNVTKKEPTFWLETCLHEILHLVFESQDLDLSYEELEKKVDQSFVELFSEIFPQYETQEFC